MEEKCVNCKISGVPLYPGLDGYLHCADCIGMLIADKPKEEMKKEDAPHVSISK